MSATKEPPTRLLLVDDDPEQLRLWEHMLRRNLIGNLQITAVSDPHAALLHAQTQGVEILVTDLSMPDVCGLDLVRYVKSRNACVQAVLLTGASTIESLLASLELGAADYLIKPVPADLLAEVVRQACDRLKRWRAALAAALRRPNSAAKES